MLFEDVLLEVDKGSEYRKREQIRLNQEKDK